MEATGIEGIFGLVISAVLLAIFQYVPCNLKRDDSGTMQFCPFGVVEDTRFALKQIGASTSLIWLVIACALLIIPEDYSGIFIVKYGSGMQRAIVKGFRSLCVWVVSMSLGWEIFSYLQVL